METVLKDAETFQALMLLSRSPLVALGGPTNIQTTLHLSPSVAQGH
jgi:hypothetical protein